MSRRAVLAAVAVSFVVTSCFFSRGAVHAYRTEEGRPPPEAGGQEAYLLWYDAGAWHLRARSELARTFHGRVETGKLKSVTPAGVPDGAVRAEGEAIAFSFVAGAEAGFDWATVNAKECPEISVYVNGEARPLRVFAGGYGASPPRVPFTICRW